MNDTVTELFALGYDHIVTERTSYGFRVYPRNTTSFFYFDRYGQPIPPPTEEV